MVQWMWLMSCLYCSYTDPFLVHVFPHIALLCKEVRICSIAHEQIVVGAAFDQSTVVQHQNLVSYAYCRQTVRNNDRCAFPRGFPQRVLNGVLCFRV